MLGITQMLEFVYNISKQYIGGLMISVCGGGAWGSALAFALAHKQEVRIFSRRKLDDKWGTPFGIRQVSLEEACEAELIVIAISVAYLREFLATMPKNPHTHYLFASKGIEEQSGAFVHQIAAEFMDPKNICALSGPSFAKEVRQCLPCAVAIHAQDPRIAQSFSTAFPSFMKMYVGDDLVGAEIAGAYKNVIAIAGGISDGLGLGNNAKAALLARGLVEMERFGRVFGAKTETFLGLSGSGDLFLTAGSTLSRNYRVGLGLAQGKSLQSVLEEIGEVAEGVRTARAIHTIATRKDIYTPIVNEVVQILNGKPCREGILALMAQRD